MRKGLLLAVLLATVAVPWSGFAQCTSCARPGAEYRPVGTAVYQPTAVYQAPAPAPVMVEQPVACGSCVPVVPSCYRTVNRPCFTLDLGVGRLMGHIFAPRCVPECQPCPTCP